MNRSRSENLGRFVGRAVRRIASAQSRVTQWIIDQGISPAIARTITWLGTMALLLVILIYAAPVLLLLVLVAALLGFARYPDTDKEPDWIPKPTDHRDEPFFHPLSFNDDPDPRFEDK